ncbi:hypothetical protein VZ95_10090 [Elstera litoralis]|uniref:Uncharacterized protein n=1 Tax=Elstera litoralis TaxID=552518 RepID=A0A0F3ISR4_9PROT|nr:hypothetical protein [Elstera litoralis]KJV09662.1 hypothetical protein VZ95_10090 [Elstera litoralis]
MARLAFLLACDQETIYPSPEADEGITLKALAVDEENIPLLWLCLFGTEQLYQAEMVATDVEGGDEEMAQLTAPLAKVTDAIARLERTVPRLEAAYPGRGSLSNHKDLLIQVLRASGLEYVTIDAADISEVFESDEDFADLLAVCLDYLNGADLEGLDDPSEILSTLCDLPEDGRFLSIPELHTSPDTTEADLITLCRLLGTEAEIPLPWEPAEEA